VNRPAVRGLGLTLAEMVLVVAVLAVATVVALPTADTISPALADAAASQVADALRFAQREALRTGIYHVVTFDTAAQTLRVYRLTTSGAIAEDTGTKVVHPVDRREYRLVFSNDPAGAATLVSAVFKYTSGATTAYASFGPDGTPAWVLDWTSKGVDPLKSDGTVTLRHGSAERTIQVAAVTGRVSF
jgi:Tfp pilus assembly protein FimT